MSAANPSVTTLTTSGVIAPGGSVHGANGSAANPSFAFLFDQNTGLYRIGVNNIGVAANGAKVLDIATTGLGITGTATISSSTQGSASAGALVVTGGLATGAASYIGGALTVSAGATFTGDVVNSASTGTYYGGTSTGGGGFANSNASAYMLAYGPSNTTFPSQLQFNSAGSVALRINGTAATFAGAVSGAAATFRPASDGVGLTLNQANSASAGWSFSALNTGSLAVTRVGGVAAITCDLNGSTTFYTSGTQTFGAVVISSGNTLKLGNPYVVGAAVGTGTITIQDSTGTTYRIPVLV